MTDRPWKRFERAIAARVGGRRLPCDGSKDGVDVDAGLFKYQCKLGRRFPAYLRTWLDGITEAGERKGAVGCVVWKEPGARIDDAVVVLRLGDWQEVIEAATLAWTLTQAYSSTNASAEIDYKEKGPPSKQSRGLLETLPSRRKPQGCDTLEDAQRENQI